MNEMISSKMEYIDWVEQLPDDVIIIKRDHLEEINIPVHKHRRYQLIYTLSGTLHIHIDGLRYFLPEAHLAWIPPDKNHVLFSNNLHVSLVTIYFCMDNPEDISILNQFNIYSTGTVILETLRFIYQRDNLISKSADRYWYDFVLSFLRVIPRISANQMPLQTLVIPDNKRLMPILRYIFAHSTENLRISDVAKQFGISTRRLSSMFNESGILFNNFLNQLRIMRAIEMFSDSNKSIQEIAYEVGFSTPNNFNRVFKRITGVNPSTFRTKQNNPDR